MTRAASDLVLLVNLGTPEAPTARAVRRYLAEFLSDPRVVDLPRPLWRPILYGIVLNARPERAAQAYRAIWREAENESPLRLFTRLQAQALRTALAPEFDVDWAMRYGEPSIAARLDCARKAGAARLCVLPLYPQYSSATNASLEDALAAALRALAWSPQVAVAAPFYDDPRYIAALRATAGRALESLGWAPERVILSFHGLPVRFIRRGDPYLEHCRTTAELLRRAMGWSEAFAPLAFQSRFGPGKWLEPAVDSMLVSLAARGVRNIAVMTPGFVSDCIETLEEIAIRARASFVGAGGERFAAIPCLNDAPEMTDLLASLARRALARPASLDR